MFGRFPREERHLAHDIRQVFAGQIARAARARRTDFPRAFSDDRCGSEGVLRVLDQKFALKGSQEIVYAENRGLCTD